MDNTTPSERARIRGQAWQKMPLPRKATNISLGTKRDSHKTFVCPEESMRYAGSLEQLVFSRFRNDLSKPTIIEFGSGTGEPVVSALINSKFQGVVHGYEINPEAVEKAERLIDACGLYERYIVHNLSFFECQRKPLADTLIANPPYIPCENAARLILPGLCGGPEGNDVSKRLLSCGYAQVFLEVSSYSNPVALVEHAAKLGYKIVDFQITQMALGVYSRQDLVLRQLQKMKSAGKAFFTENCYLVGSAFFTKTAAGEQDLSAEFLACLTALIGYACPRTASDPLGFRTNLANTAAAMLEGA